jgi:hypothetical protein
LLIKSAFKIRVALNRVNPYNLPGSSNWTFPDSINKWYNPIASQQYKFSDLGFTLPNYKMSFVFLYKCTEISKEWRGIFLFSNDPDGIDCWWKSDPKSDCRIPGLFVKPDSADLSFRIHTNDSWDDGMDLYGLPINETVLVTIVINNNTVTFYKNDKLVLSKTFNDIKPRTINTRFTVTNWNSPYYKTIGVKNLTFYDGELKQEDVNKIYKKLQDDYEI